MGPKATLVSMMSSTDPDIKLFTPYLWSLIPYFHIALQPPNRLGLTLDQKQSWSAWWALPILISNFLPPTFDLWSLIFFKPYSRTITSDWHGTNSKVGQHDESYRFWCQTFYPLPLISYFLRALQPVRGPGSAGVWRHRLLSLGTADFWAPWVFGRRGCLGAEGVWASDSNELS